MKILGLCQSSEDTPNEVGDQQELPIRQRSMALVRVTQFSEQSKIRLQSLHKPSGGQVSAETGMVDETRRGC
jgi:hypothetical protein